MVSSPNAGRASALELALARGSALPPARDSAGSAAVLRAPARPRAHMADIDPLIERAQTGEPRAMRELFERYRSDVARIAFRVLGPSADLEDVVQEAFVQLYRSLPRYRGEAKFSTWLYRVVVNVARMHVRRQRARPALSSAPRSAVDRLSSDSGRPDAAAERSERVSALYAALNALSDKKRAVLVLHDIAGVNAADIADIVGAPVLTVRTRLFYARKQLYAALASDPALSDVLVALRAGENPRGRAGGDSG